ncbi:MULTISPECIES: tetratricopeptide repeat protein [Thalassospira]|uniref:protein O-GlcNAc transferase n=2 Tax=Thalassospira TaxID=168934 RepID=A0A367W6R1_9PROT|nr:MULTISPECIES: tetratricopeptide repeat protein [Thalassospira]MDG4719203.1 tetratricopeptide repeat protein [Thalassospira sp. FZY0004]RCK37125.1 acetylglucosamine transferase [Thalassospira profundimaris]
MSDQLKTLLRRGLTAHEGNRPEEAEKIYRQVLDIAPNNAEAEHLLATLLTGLGRHGEAIDLFESCLSSFGANPAARCNYAIALETSGQIEKAIDQFKQAISYHGDFPTALYHLARLEMPRGHLGQTVDLLGRLLGLKPDHYEGLLLFGDALHALGQEEAALTSLEHAAQAAGISPDLICRVAGTYLRLGYPTQAQNLYQRALSINAKFVPGLRGLGQALAHQGYYAKAVALLKTARQLTKDTVEIDLVLADITLKCGDLVETIDNLESVLKKHPDHATADALLLRAKAKLASADATDHAKDAKNWAKHHMPIAARPKFANTRQADKRLRIGWLSPFFCEHPAHQLLRPLARHLNRHEVELFLYSATPRPDDVTRSWQVMADGWREVFGQDPMQIADRIRKDKVDILIDLCGVHPTQPIEVFALYAAPVQASLSTITTGIAQIDYLIGHKQVFAGELASNKLFSERGQKLDLGPFVPDQLEDARPVSPLPAAFGDGTIRFGCIDRVANISDQTLNCFARMLNKVKNSRIVIQDDVLEDSYAAKTFLDRIRQAGINRDRLDLAGGIATDDRASLFAQIDIGLAPFPSISLENYYEMLWHGVPFISLANDLPGSRLGLGLLTDIGLEALCAQTEKGYVDKAIMLSSDLSALASIRENMRDRIRNSKAFHAPAVAREFEEACREMWQNFCLQKG